jgi:hypothetical protein
MSDDLAAGGLQWGGAGVGSEMVLGGEPADVADLAEEGGGQHRPDPEQLQQAGVGLDDRRLDAHLDRGDPLLQVMDVGDELAGELVASDRRRTSGRDPGQQRGGALGGEVASGAAWDQVDQQPMQPVDGLGAPGDQVLPPLGQQLQHHRLVLDADPPQLGGAAGGDRHRDRVVSIALAAMADRQHPHPGSQLGRHVQDLLAVADQPLGHCAADAVGALDRPAALRPALGPLAQLLVAVDGGEDALLAEQLAVLVERGRGVGGLVGVDADHHRHAGTFLEGREGATGEGRPTLGRAVLC